MTKRTHISRGWAADGFAPECGCELLPCGFVDAQGAADRNCDQHAPGAGRTIRASHPALQCDEEFARTAYPEEPDYVYDTDVLGEDDYGNIFALREGSSNYWERFDRSKPSHLSAMERTKESGRIAFLELEDEPS